MCDAKEKPENNPRPPLGLAFRFLLLELPYVTYSSDSFALQSRESRGGCAYCSFYSVDPFFGVFPSFPVFGDLNDMKILLFLI